MVCPKFGSNNLKAQVHLELRQCFGLVVVGWWCGTLCHLNLGPLILTDYSSLLPAIFISLWSQRTLLTVAAMHHVKRLRSSQTGSFHITKMSVCSRSLHSQQISIQQEHLWGAEVTNQQLQWCHHVSIFGKVSQGCFRHLGESMVQKSEVSSGLTQYQQGVSNKVTKWVYWHFCGDDGWSWLYFCCLLKHP